MKLKIWEIIPYNIQAKTFLMSITNDKDIEILKQEELLEKDEDLDFGGFVDDKNGFINIIINYNSVFLGKNKIHHGLLVHESFHVLSRIYSRVCEEDYILGLSPQEAPAYQLQYIYDTLVKQLKILKKDFK